MTRPFSQACENNKQSILDVISQVYAAGETILEVGSGTAQHVLHFASHLQDVTWQPSEMPASLATLEAGLEGLLLPNIQPPVVLEVQQPWPELQVQGIFSANCLHIMSAQAVADFFAGVKQVLAGGGNLCVYGPFKYNGEFTTASNARFDEWLKDRDSRSGIRDFETVNGYARDIGLALVADHALPANNQLLHWVRGIPS